MSTEQFSGLTPEEMELEIAKRLNDLADRLGLPRPDDPLSGVEVVGNQEGPMDQFIALDEARSAVLVAGIKNLLNKRHRARNLRRQSGR